MQIPPNTIFSKSIKFAQRKPYRWPWRNESKIKDDLKPQFTSQLSRHNTIASGAPPRGLFSFILLAFSIYFIAASDPLNYSVPNWNGIMKNTTGPRRAKEATNPPNRENWDSTTFVSTKYIYFWHYKIVRFRLFYRESLLCTTNW